MSIKTAIIIISSIFIKQTDMNVVFSIFYVYNNYNDNNNSSNSNYYYYYLYFIIVEMIITITVCVTHVLFTH